MDGSRQECLLRQLACEREYTSHSEMRAGNISIPLSSSVNSGPSIGAAAAAAAADGGASVRTTNFRCHFV